MQFHFLANQSQFHENCFALRLALKQGHKGTRKVLFIKCSPISLGAPRVFVGADSGSGVELGALSELYPGP